MDIAKLRYFYAVARAGSFTKAAREIRVAQPSLSKMVQALEAELGEILFMRSKSGVELTGAGRLVLESCKLIFAEVDALAIGLTEMHQEITGDLSVGASDNLCNYLLPPLFDELVKRYPKIKVKLFSGTSADIQKELEEGRIELGCFYTKVSGGRDFLVRPLRFIEFVLVANSPLKLRELNGAPFIGSRTADYKNSYPAMQMLNSIGISPKTIFETNNQETQKRMVLRGSGFSLLPIHMVEQELSSKTLYRITSPKQLGAEISLLQRRGKNLSKPAQVFEKMMLAGR